MAEPYVGEIRMFGGSFAPLGWEFCDGRLMRIAEYETLFQLIGTSFGGDGHTTFALPDLRGRWAVGAGGQYAHAHQGGAATVTLTTAQIPSHTHAALGSVAAASSRSPQGAVWGATTTPSYVAPASTPSTPMAPDALTPQGGSQPHENRPPYVGTSFIISMLGIFPTQN